MSAPSDQTEAIVDAALDLAPEERAAYLDQACGGDARLRQNVEAMLHAYQHAPILGRLLPHTPKPPVPEANAVTEKPGLRRQSEEKEGDRIGHYKLLQQIGEGGCGVVYMAEQKEPVRRRVALKVIKLGMDTKQVIARFEAERQALALMDHPNIAKVLDAGATDAGRPYFVMELVRGIKITDYCDQNNLATHQRLELFMQVCRAIQHAHQKGIIHRDIKPSNILVTLHDGVAVPKVIDFGIAKATEQRLTDKTLFTALEQFIGTPAYMSPEQAELSGLDIDTRSDIYSLGVLLYELLTGQMPFDPKALQIAGLEEMRRMIRENDPVKPSTKLNSLAAADQTTVARQRQVEAPRLIYLVRGDLDWIAMKCLEKDRTRRYETANGLVADIKRHLDNEPVVARPPSNLYRFQKLVRRNKGIFAALGAVAVTLLAGSAASTYLYLEEAKLRQAVSRGAEQARQAETNALVELKRSYLAQAQAGRWSQRAGRRFEGLELLKKAAALQPTPASRNETLALRNEAIACMTLTDLQAIKEWDAYPPDGIFGSFDANHERYVFGDAQGVVHVRRASDDAEVAGFEGYQPPFQTLEFDRTGSVLCIAAGPRRDRVEVWNLEPKELILRLHEPLFRTMAFSADSRLVVVSVEGETNQHPVRIYNLAERREIASFPHGTLPYTLAFNPRQPNLLLTSDASPAVRVWDWEARRLVRTFTHPGWVQGIDWHPAGKLFATACSDERVRVWEMASGEPLAELAHHQAPAVSVAFLQGGALLASHGWDGVLQLWDLASQREVVEREVSGFMRNFSRPANKLVLGLQSGRIALLEAVSGHGWRMLADDHVRGERTFSCGFNADSSLFISTHKDRVCCWDLVSGKLVGEISKAATWEHFAVFHPDEQRFFLRTRQGLEDWSLLPSGTNRLRLNREKVCPVDGSYIMTVTQDGQYLGVSGPAELQIINTQTSSKVASLKPGYAPVFGALSPDGRAAVSWGRESSDVQIWDVARSAIVQKLPARLCNHAAFSANSRWLLVGTGAEMRVWDVATWKSRYALPCKSAGFFGLSAFSPDNQLLAAVTTRSVVRLTEASSGREVATLEMPDHLGISWLTFNPDSTKLAVAVTTGPIQIYDLRLIRQELAAMHLDW